MGLEILSVRHLQQNVLLIPVVEFRNESRNHVRQYSEEPCRHSSILLPRCTYHIETWHPVIIYYSPTYMYTLFVLLVHVENSPALPVICDAIYEHVPPP